MEIAKRRREHMAAYVLAVASLLLSLLALYVRLYFWQGMTYTPIHIWSALYFIIVAGPLAIWLAVRSPRIAIALSLAQLMLVAIASI